MDTRQVAQQVLEALGGTGNIKEHGVCMTRLRIVVRDPSCVNGSALGDARGVLGVVRRGDSAFEVVFGPSIVDDVFQELSLLTGLPESISIGAGLEGLPSVQIKAPIDAGKRLSFDQQASALARALGAEGDEESAEGVDVLTHILNGSNATETEPKNVLVINGPNINMLGVREPELYGTADYKALLELCHEAAKEAGFANCSCLQSNHEGDLIDAIQEAYGAYAGIVINPGAYTHTSIALLDALKAVRLPAIEVHITDVDEREPFRRISYVRSACFETISGLGIEGYRKAILDLAAHIGL